MLIWLVAVVAGSAAAFAQYRFGGALHARVPLVMRALALTIVVGLLLDGPIGPSRAARTYVALDASASWRAGGDSSLWRRAVATADSARGDSLLLFGDSLRGGGSMRAFFQTLHAALCEIFDESAYARFLARRGIPSSVDAYAEFLRETESARARKPRCC